MEVLNTQRVSIYGESIIKEHRQFIGCTHEMVSFRGVGCIFAEMTTGTALFPGRKDVIDQLERIFRIRGVPDTNKWPQV